MPQVLDRDGTSERCCGIFATVIIRQYTSAFQFVKGRAIEGNSLGWVRVYGELVQDLLGVVPIGMVLHEGVTTQQEISVSREKSKG